MVSSITDWLSSWLCLTCSGWQSVLLPEGPRAAALHQLLWLFIWICGGIWVLVMLVLLVSLRRRRGAPPPLLALNAGRERLSGMIVGVAVFFTVVIISGLTFLSYAATRGISPNSGD